MKLRNLFAVMSWSILVLVASPALADNGPHGNFNPTTDGCAGCHRAHTGSVSALLISTVPNLCLTCHGSDGTGADTNVIDGQYMERDGVTEPVPEIGDGVSLKGGGFLNVLMDSDWDGAATPSSATSTHIYDGSAGTAWGNGLIGSGVGATGFIMTCTTCHDPHGGAGVDPVTGERMASYRILRDIPTGSNADPLESSANDPPVYPIADETDKVYTLVNTVGDDTRLGHTDHGKNEFQYFGEPPQRGMTEWCSQCHTRYMSPLGAGGGGTPGGGSIDSGDDIFTYRHATLGVTSTNYGYCTVCHFASTNQYDLHAATAHNVGCASCHVAHGTSATMTGEAAAVEWPDGSTSPSGDERSSLLRMDNRGVCEMCHEKG